MTGAVANDPGYPLGAARSVRTGGDVEAGRGIWPHAREIVVEHINTLIGGILIPMDPPISRAQITIRLI
jgi:hypothetical protein